MVIIRKRNVCWFLLNTKKIRGQISFAQRRYRKQWGSTELRLLLVENFNQYPAMTTWNTVGYGNFWRFERTTSRSIKLKKKKWENSSKKRFLCWKRHQNRFGKWRTHSQSKSLLTGHAMKLKEWRVFATDFICEHFKYKCRSAHHITAKQCTDDVHSII